MKFSYAIDRQKKLIFLRYQGRFSLPQLIACTQQVWADPGYCPTFDGIVEATDGSLAIEIEEFRSFLGFMQTASPVSRGRWAVITAAPFATACGMLYRHAMGRRHVLEIFSTWETASAFLCRGDLTPPPRETIHKLDDAIV